MSDPKRPRGLRIIDLIAGIFVIGVLLGLILPAMNTSSGHGRRGQCQNNLKNIALGLLGYSMTHGAYPDSGTFFDDPADHQGDPLKSNIYKALTNPSVFATGTNPCRSNWVVATLPYLDEQELYNAWNFGESYLSTQKSGPNSISNARIASTSNSILRCPNDMSAVPGQGNLSYVVNGGFSRWQAIPLSWAGGQKTPASGPVLDWVPSGSPWRENQAVARQLGVMFLGTHSHDQSWDLKTRAADLVDGASQTLLLGENTLTGYSAGTAYSGGLPTNWACPLPTFVMFLGSDNVCNTAKSATDCLGGQLAPTSQGKSGPGWAWANRKGTGEEIDGAGGFNVEGGFPYANSGHGGSINFVFCDGSVKALTPSIDGTVYSCLLTPAGSQLPPFLRQQSLVADEINGP